MIKYTILLCFVAVISAQWVDPDWSSHVGVRRNNLMGRQRYPPLPGSVQVFDEQPHIGNILLPTPKPSTSTSAPQTTTPPPPPTCQSMFGCSDCHTAQVCLPNANGQLVQSTQISCPLTAPYCDYSSGTCTTVPDPTCGSKDSFICPGNGYYPDPSNCSVYHVCNDYKPSKFSCVDSQHYDADNMKCSTNATCETIDCTGQLQVKAPLGNTQYFAFCRNGSPFIVTKCQGEYKLNTTSQNCEAICEVDGLMADAELCTSYYKCYTMYFTSKESIRIREHLACPTGEAFQSSSYQCVPQSMTSCKT